MNANVMAAGTMRMLFCQVGDSSYAIDMKFVKSILREEQVYWNTDGNPSPDGWLLAGGAGAARFPVYSLAGRLGFEFDKTKTSQRVLVLATEQGNWGLVVDNVSQAVQIKNEQFVQMPSVIKNAVNCFDGLVRLNDKFVLILSTEKLHPDAKPVASYNTHDNSKISFPSSSNETMATGSGRLLLFSLTAGERSSRERSVYFGLSVTQVLEVLHTLPLISVPKSPRFIQGLADWHNYPVPVIDLAAHMGLPSLSETEATRLIICRGGDKETLFGFQVYQSVRMLSLPVAHKLSQRDLPINKNLCRAVVELKNETLVIPDTQQIFSGNKLEAGIM